MRDLIWYVLAVPFSQCNPQHLMGWHNLRFWRMRFLNAIRNILRDSIRFWGMHFGLIQKCWSREGVVLGPWLTWYWYSLGRMHASSTFSFQTPERLVQVRGEGWGEQAPFFSIHTNSSRTAEAVWRGCNSSPSPSRPLRSRRAAAQAQSPASGKWAIPPHAIRIEDSPQIRFHTESSSAHRGGAPLQRCSAMRGRRSARCLSPMPDASRAPPRPSLVWSPHPLPPCAPAFGVGASRARARIDPCHAIACNCGQTTGCPQSRERS